MIIINCPDNFRPHREWVASVLLGDFLGISCHVVFSDTNKVTFEFDGRALELPDTFFELAAAKWQEPGSLPDIPLARWDTTQLAQEINLVDPTVPIVYGSGSFQRSTHHIRLPIDVLGSAFVLLSRYEETIGSERDTHGRSLCASSLAGRDGFIERPLVDEYLEVLWVAMQQLWPGLDREPTVFRCVVTCDVDHPFDPMLRSPAALPLRIAADLFKRHSLRAATETLGYGLSYLRHGVRVDRMWTFDWMMSACEQYGLSCSFYFIVGNNHPLDGLSYWGNRRIDELMREMHDRGHEIGLHASYRSFVEPDLVIAETERLKKKCASLGIEQETWGGRQHYLRWSADSTWRNWSEAGLNYDSTLAYAEQPGFRCGTCRPYATFDLREAQVLPLIERPLVVMEGSVLSPAYKGMDHASAQDLMIRMQKTVRQFGGEFVLLWHNSHFLTAGDRELYIRLLAGCQ